MGGNFDRFVFLQFWSYVLCIKQNKKQMKLIHALPKDTRAILIGVMKKHQANE